MQMAARLVLADAVHGQVAGQVSADDADESLLVDFLGRLGAAAPGFTAEGHGAGTFSLDDVMRVRELDADSPLAGFAPADGHPDEAGAVARWASVLSAVFGAATGPLSWTMSYDVGGTVDDGPSEYVTGGFVV
jgi:hypothetical protein